MKEDKASWLEFLRWLMGRGLTGTQLFINDRCSGLVEALGECFTQTAWQRCIVHFYRNVFSAVPPAKVKEVAAMLKAIHAQEDGNAMRQKAPEVVAKLAAMRLTKAMETVQTGIEETLAYTAFPNEHWRRIRTNNPLERLNREIHRRTRVVGASLMGSPRSCSSQPAYAMSPARPGARSATSTSTIWTTDGSTALTETGA